MADIADIPAQAPLNDAKRLQAKTIMRLYQYYMTEMAPGLNALVGIGLVVMWRDYCSSNRRGWLLPIALVVTTAAQIYMLQSYPSYERWLSPLIGISTVLVVILLIVFRLSRSMRLNRPTFRLATLATGVGLLALLVAPSLWTGYSVIHNTESSFPIAGPNALGNTGIASFFGGNVGNQGANNTRANRQNRLSGQNGNFGGSFGGRGAQADSALISYLEAHQGSAKFLLATSNSNSADAIILATNKPVMALGGFSGNDPILTVSKLQTLIKNGTVHFFLLNAPRTTQGRNGGATTNNRGNNFYNGGFGGSRQNTSLTTWISNHCSAVPTSAWQSTTRAVSGNSQGNQLYDCASLH